MSSCIMVRQLSGSLREPLMNERKETLSGREAAHRKEETL
jgi:hypothetical protein